MTLPQSLVPYELQPPEWRPPLLLTRSGNEACYPELFPGTTALYPHANGNVPPAVLPGGPHPGTASTSATPAKEDDLSESVVKSGFVNRAVIQVRSYRDLSSLSGLTLSNLGRDRVYIPIHPREAGQGTDSAHSVQLGSCST